MAVGDMRIYSARSAAHGATTINSATHFAVTPTTIKAADPGPAGSPGLADEIVVDRDIVVTVFAEDPSELDSLVEASAANFVGGFVGEGGANKTVTVKNVKFNDPPTPTFPPKDPGGTVGRFSITGRAQWGTLDTWSTMIVYA